MLPLLFLLLGAGLGTERVARAQALVIDEVDPIAWDVDTEQERAEGLRHRYVRVNPNARGQAVGLNLFPDAQVTARLRHQERHLGTSTWLGSVDGDPLGIVALGFHDDGTVAGKVEFGERIFLIRPKGGGVHAVVEIDWSSMEDEGDDAILPEEAAGKQGDAAGPEELAAVSICEQGAQCSAQVVDLMVVYTPSARDGFGGTDAAAQAAIAAAVAEMNEANRVSGVIHSVRLAYAGPVSYTESGSISTDLTRMRATQDGYLDDVHALRDTYMADVVSLVTETGGCGVAYVQTEPTGFDQSLSFNVVGRSCLVGNKTLTHEVGHNLGMHHDWYVTGATRPCTWAHGYVNREAFGGTAEQRWRTVMAYDSECAAGGFSCRRLAAWSNPEVQQDGDPMGVPRTEINPADGAYLLNRSICQVAQFRQANTPLVVITPNGGETWKMGQSVSIWWTGSNTSNVDILLQRQSSTVQTLASNISSSGSLGWTVSSSLTPACDYQIRVQASSKTNTYDVSDAPFCIESTVAPTLAVKEPLSDLTRLHGESLRVVWDGSGLSGVNLRLIGEGSEVATIQDGTASGGQLDWVIPSTIPPACGYIVRAISSTDPAVYADSPGSLCVEAPIPPALAVAAPNGGENWTIGVQETIQWTSQGAVGNVDIILLDISNAETVVATNLTNDGSETWVVPDGLAVECGYRIHLKETGSAVSDDSDAAFCITRTLSPKLAVSEPKEDAVWVKGSVGTIAWQGSDIGPVDLSLHNGEPIAQIAQAQAATASLDWEVPESLSAGCGYVIRARSTGADGLTADSAPICIENAKQPAVAVVRPNSPQTFAQETEIPIEWTRTDVSAVDVSLERDGNPVAVLGTALTSLSMNWSIPLTIDPDCTYRIRVTAVDGSATDVSDEPFCVEATLRPQIAVSSPSGSTTWQIETAGTISWSSSNVTSTIVELVKSGIPVRLIDGAAPASGTIEWMIPDGLPLECDYAIRVSSSEDPAFFVESEGRICIAGPPPPAVTFAQPHQGTVWEAGTNGHMAWESQFSNNVRIEFWSERGDQWSITKATSNSGSYTWAVPADVPTADDYFVRIYRVGKSEEGGRTKRFKVVPRPEKEEPLLGAAKALVGAPVEQRDNTVTISFEIVLRNMGNATLKDLHVTDDLASAFGEAIRWWVEGLSSSDFLVNPAFDGGQQTEMLVAGNDLAPGREGRLSLVVNVLPQTSNQSFSNQILARGRTSGGKAVEDLSHSGGNPDADGDGNPQNDNDPTTVVIHSDVLPVELVAFEGRSQGRRIDLTWSTATEERNAGFVVERSLESAPFENIGWVEGAGTSQTVRDYSFVEEEANFGFHRFRLRIVDFEGAYDYSPTIEVRVESPDEYFIEPIYPNPFNPEAVVRFGVAKAQHVRVELHSILGSEVRVLFDGALADRETRVVKIDGHDLASGTYLVRFAGQNFAGSRTLTLIK